MMGTKLSSVEHHPYLGAEFTSDLSWGLHIKNICGKAERSVNFLQRNLHDCPSEVKATAYNAFVRPNLEYSSAVWDPHQQKDIKRLERVQRKGAHFVTRFPS